MFALPLRAGGGSRRTLKPSLLRCSSDAKPQRVSKSERYCGKWLLFLEQPGICHHRGEGRGASCSNRRLNVARKYSRSASKDVKGAMRKRKRGTLKSGRSGKKVTSRKQAIATGLSEARRKGKKVPKKRASSR